jgi:hypothetical protein
MILPKSGRFLIRRYDATCAHVIGVLHFDEEFAPVEGACYVAVLASRTAAILPDPVDSEIPHALRGQGVDAMLRGPCWHRTKLKGTLTVRFLRACSESNAWVVFGVANQPLLPAKLYTPDGLSWNDVLDGDCRVIASPAPGAEYGATCEQILADLAVWPDREGRALTLPVVESNLREPGPMRAASLSNRDEQDSGRWQESGAIASSLIANLGLYGTRSSASKQ